MLKKLTKVGMLLGLMAIATTGFAQNETKTTTQDFPRYGFWSNWSVGGAFEFNKDFNKSFKLGQGANIGGELRFTKQLNYNWKFRMLMNMPGILSTVDTTTGYEPMDRLAETMVGFSYNFCKHFYGFMDGGMAWKSNKWGKALCADMGLGLNWDFGSREQNEIFVEAGLNCVADIDRGLPEGINRAFLKLGYAYNFGLTKVDQELAAQKALLTQENFDALNAQINGLEEQLAAAKANEQRLENRVAELENELANAKKNNCAEADSLQRLLDQMRSEQGKFYGLPFSILFDVDSYTIKASEAAKLKAIAQVMKENSDAKFNIVGYCDYTGSDAYNQKLSEKRAEAVKKQLVNKYGIDEDRLTVSGKGKGEAYGDIKLSINRRVSFFRAM